MHLPLIASYCLYCPHHSLASYSSFTSPPPPVKGKTETQLWRALYIIKNDNIQQRKLIEYSGRFERWDRHCRSANIPAGWSPSSGTSASYKAFNSHKSSSFNWQWREAHIKMGSGPARVVRSERACRYYPHPAHVWEAEWASELWRHNISIIAAVIIQHWGLHCRG